MLDIEANQNSLDTSEEKDVELSAVRDLIVELKEMYNEFLLQVKLVQKDLIRSSKYDELEAKVLFFVHNISLTFPKFNEIFFAVYKYNVRVTIYTKRTKKA